MQDRKKILFILPSLVAGGAERIISFLSQNLDDKIFAPTLLIIGKEQETAYNVDRVKTIYLEKERVLQGVLPMYKQIKKLKPDLVVTAIGHLNAAAGILSIFFPRIKFVAREVNVLSVAKKFKKSPSPLISIAAKVGYRYVDAFICQSKDMQNDFLKLNKVPKEKVHLINNPVTDGFELLKSDINIRNPIKFITVASLKKQKGHLRILNALSKFEDSFTYTIIGNGSELEAVLSKVKELGLESNVTHVLHTNKVPKYLADNDIFLQGAFVEGFPNCLLESCSVGTPVLAFNAPGGLDEIIDYGVNGFVAKNEEEFIQLLHKSKDYAWNPKKISESVTSKFGKEIILKKYETLFLEVLK